MKKSVNNNIIIAFTVMMFVVIGFSVNDSFAVKDIFPEHQADIDFNPSTNDVTITWDLNVDMDKGNCLMKTQSKQITPHIHFKETMFGTDLKKWRTVFLNNDNLTKELSSIIPCIGKFQFNIVNDFNLIKRIEALALTTFFYEQNSRNLTLLKQVTLPTIDLNEITFTSSDSKATQYHQPTTILQAGLSHAITPITPIQPIEQKENKKSGGSDNRHLTKPTFGLSHSTFKSLVQCGYSHQGICYDITDNWHMEFEKIEIKVGEPQEIIIKGYFQNGVKGIGWGLVPQVGEYHKAEVKIQVYIDNYDQIEKIYTEQKHNIVDMDNIIYEYYEEPCGFVNSICDVLKMSNVIFMAEPKFEKIAIFALDDKNRSHITFLNDGYDIFGESLNEPLISKTTAGNGGALYPQRVGTVELKLIDYKTDTWQDKYGYLWTSNNYKNFKIISKIPVPISAPDKVVTIIDRNHSEFYRIIDYELKRALEIFDSSTLISELPNSIQTDFSEENIELDWLKSEYNKQIEVFKAEKYLMDSQSPSKKIYKKFQTDYNNMEIKYTNSLSLILEKIRELEHPY